MTRDLSAGVLIVGECDSNGVLRPVSLELATAGRALADAAGGPLAGLLAVGGGGGSESAFAGSGLNRLLVVSDERLAAPSVEAMTAAVVAAVRAVNPAIVLIPGTTLGRDYAPKVAARLGSPLAADCIGFSLDGDVLLATRTVFGGRAQATVRLAGSETAFATVRAGSFPKAGTGEPVVAEPLAVEFGPDDFRTAVTALEAKDTGATGLATAEVVVTGGRGLKEPANFALVDELAAALGGATGATRAVVDAGWRSHGEQIGQTGRTVAPRLYIAVGVSGAVQHNVGMQGSEHIVAINRDPDAPIFKIARFGIAGDLFEIVPALVRELEANRDG